MQGLGSGRVSRLPRSFAPSGIEHSRVLKYRGDNKKFGGKNEK